MKKIISIFAVIAMLCAFSTTAFAATPIESVTNGANSDSHDVVAKYNGGVSTPDVYSVEVQWGAMEFTYNVGGTKDWDAANHSYKDNSSANWTENGNTVTVTNHSNKAITAYFGFTKDSAITENITGLFDVNSQLLNAGTVGGYDTADKVTSILTIGGALDSAKTALTKIGSVTVTIA